jgi:hypothetical protein
LIFTVIFALSVAHAAHAVGVIGTIPVGTWPLGVAYDSGKGEIFVTNEISNTVSVISDSPNLFAPFVSSSPGAVDQGQTSSLTSTALTTGAAPYKYQWFSKAPGISSYSSIGGANSSSYNFVTSTSTATGSWSFILQVADATGAAVNSTAATVTVNVAPTVSITPASWTMDVGQSRTFNSSVSGGALPYSYQWYLNGSLVSGATSSSWTFKPTSTGVYEIYVKTTDALNAVAQSSKAQVKVKSGGLGLVGVALVGVVVVAVACAGAVGYKMRKRQRPVPISDNQLYLH